MNNVPVVVFLELQQQAAMDMVFGMDPRIADQHMIQHSTHSLEGLITGNKPQAGEHSGSIRIIWNT